MECLTTSVDKTPDENKPLNCAEEDGSASKTASPFKKPILIGKIGRLPRKITEKQLPTITPTPPAETSKNPEPTTPEEVDRNETDLECESNPKQTCQKSPAELISDNKVSLPYKEPSWSGLPTTCGDAYKFEVLKSGVIIEYVDLMKQPFWVFGRLLNCDVVMAHPTISRYHAVLQFKAVASEDRPSGFYLYDLGSTHGTFLNKNRIKPRMYVRVQVGHMLKLGCSTRSYILSGPLDDAEEESDLTVSQLKQKRADELKQREEDALKAEQTREERLKKEEERGVDWGMGEDADQEEDLTENPYAQTNNEDLYIEDPKKALRGFMEREGFEYEYDVNEQGMGQFLCKVVLPIDDARGRPLVAEALVKGKKKEAVVQCALEACRLLDRHGVLRQSHHESRKRKSKNWEEDDYYDSDDDTFLDRTGTVEKKREKRMKAVAPQQPETYQSLLEKENGIKDRIAALEKQLDEFMRPASTKSSKETDDDSLDSFMKDLTADKPDKQTISKLKTELGKLKQEHMDIVKLVNIAKPAHLPALVVNKSDINSQPGTSGTQGKSKLPLFGKRIKVKVQIPTRENLPDDEDNDDEDDAEEESVAVSEATSADEPVKCEPGKSETANELEVVEKFAKLINQPDCSQFSEKHQQKLSKISQQLQKLACKEDQMNVDWKLLTAKKHKVLEQIVNLSYDDPDPKMQHIITSELNRMLKELDKMTAYKCKVIDTVKKIGTDISLISAEIKEMNDQIKSASNSPEPVENEIEEEKRKKKNLRRIQQRQERAEVNRQKGYQQDSQKEDYNMWVPPEDQKGDGRTNLNDKFGY